jgi:glycosyltransferase involved in cell wall biosynthesis
VNRKGRSILFVIGHLGDGGAEMHVVRLANQLCSRWNVSIVSLSSEGPYRPLLDRRIRCVEALKKRRKSALAEAAASLPILWTTLRVSRPDLICSVLALPSIAAWVVRKCGFNKVPWITLIQNNVRADLDALPENRRLIMRLLLSNAYSSCCGLIASSFGVRQSLDALSVALQRKCEVIYNIGFDDRFVLNDRNRVPSDGRSLVACGRLAAQKNYPLLLKAFALARQKLPDLTLTVLGDGPERGKLERLVKSLDLHRSVRFAGFVPDPQAQMARADALVLSSDYEGFGNVIVEAMALGTPVISTDCPYGPSEIIATGQTGVLVPVGDVESLADAIVSLLNDPARRHFISVNAMSRARDFSPLEIAKQYERHFRLIQACHIGT